MSVLKRLFSDKIAVFCMIVIAAFVIVAIGAPVLAPHDPAEIDVTNKFAAMSAAYPLGTDQLGRCILSRMMYGARTTIFVSLYTMAITIFIGSVLGIISGFFRGWVDEVIMRICDIMLSFPSEVMILSIIGVLGIGMKNLVIATIIAKWAWYTRMIRSIVIQYNDKNYIRFSKVAGCSTWHIITKHILPATLGEIAVLATLDIGGIILNISAMSFLGLGVQPPTAEWGMMLNEAKTVLMLHPSQMMIPGVAILTVVAVFNFFGDCLQDAFNPKHSSYKKKAVNE